ncbi:Alpha/Beta hydrolase protein [Microdochium bolleyi]|uniref:feruloyl esterase n=1 Tax=Microdochium bolleyi TaxID=196109 RepID=A0A136J5U9_9PEZI|nr:Alpha/Beta hydrolase protein [Microdochium bolleyi]
MACRRNTSTAAGLLLATLALASGMARAAASPGCGTPAPAKLGVLTEVKLALNDSVGGERRYFYWLPPSYSASAQTPAVVSFHGGKSSAKQQAEIDYFTSPSFNNNNNPTSSGPPYVVVYPEATFQAGTTSRYWQVSPEMAAQGTDDVGYTLAVLADLRGRVCLDDSRVYATGMSQGGGMANLLACNATSSGLFAAYAPVSGSYYYRPPAQSSGGEEAKCHPASDQLPCSPGRSGIPIFAFHGAADATINYTGGDRRGACTPDIPHWAEQWAVRDKLDASAVVTSTTVNTTTGEQSLGGTAERYSYGSGASSGLVQLIMTGKDAGHVWPATFSRISEATGLAQGSGPTRFNASSLILDFFGRYKLANSTSGPSSSPTSSTGPGIGTNSSPSSSSSSAPNTATRQHCDALGALVSALLFSVVVLSGYIA